MIKIEKTSQQQEISKQRYPQIDVLRGIAAVSVCFFHLTGSSGLSTASGQLGKFGYLGVEMFFVISGFIIPYSMYLKKYRTSQFGSFMLKRLLRINPPYVAIIIFTLLMIFITKREILPSFESLFYHFFYINTFVGHESISPVFWTLIIEFQYYIFIGLFYFIISHKSVPAFVAFTQLILIANILMPNSNSLIGWFGLFVLGIILFRFEHGMLSTYLFFALVIETAAVIVYKNGIYESLAGLLSLACIHLIKINNKSMALKSLLFLGTISYSLYLVHWEFGRALVAITRHIPAVGNYEIFRILVGMAGSIMAAWIFYYFIEKPSIKLAGYIQLKNNG